MIRAFLAFDVSEDVRQNLGGLLRTFTPQTENVRWVDPAQMHGTLKFFGDIDEAFLMDAVSQVIEREAQSFAPAQMHAVGVGVFPNWKYPRIFWSGFTGDVETVLGWHQRLESAFTEFNIAKDPRAFRMHLTLGRVRSPLKNAPWLKTLEKMVTRDFGSTTLDTLVLYKSELTKKGSVYTALRVFPF